MKTSTFRLDGDRIRVELAEGAEAWLVTGDHASFQPVKRALASKAALRGSDLGLTDSRVRKLLLRAERAGLASSLPLRTPA
jgi:hypothetical protein